ncbi:hypothetical protein [Helicovermis profundi]|uniref:Uncharacterized protein n=1 Tax=Helicovermis profundi TaxID=3065157 RepID=A0AAU9E6D5_9FIRM|nr:hypothetical protein HLPR_23690 [Clostridia bacterium S502]
MNHVYGLLIIGLIGFMLKKLVFDKKFESEKSEFVTISFLTLIFIPYIIIFASNFIFWISIGICIFFWINSLRLYKYNNM